ncbi:NAD-dependent deacylase [Oricola thermophila]|uniref:NAD-dependent protein deacylase n=1 Tax=Oricola thermophila TaxID=2742145 RepID=A0A6N1VIA4_9HYPH|nr:NAD-dependent deacylase [Oricola thermophila]QKV18889.1 NAD-dependent deacylase [Oricola thermophila]
MNIVVLTGAGISAESGLSTFRDPDGVWARYDPMQLATPEAFAADPELVHAFYNDRRSELRAVRPNAAHEALVRLEDALGDDFLLVTQNIDDLHERAGSRKLIHMHGELRRAWCRACENRFDWEGDMTTASACPACGTVGYVRPDIVWFGEMPYRMEEIFRRLDACDLFVAIGTSGAVYPAAEFVEIASRTGAETVELNLQRSDGTHLFDSHRHGPATRIVPAFIDELLARLKAQG